MDIMFNYVCFPLIYLGGIPDRPTIVGCRTSHEAGFGPVCGNEIRSRRCCIRVLQMGREREEEEEGRRIPDEAIAAKDERWTMSY